MLNFDINEIIIICVYFILGMLGGIYFQYFYPLKVSITDHGVFTALPNKKLSGLDGLGIILFNVTVTLAALVLLHYNGMLPPSLTLIKAIILFTIPLMAGVWCVSMIYL